MVCTHHPICSGDQIEKNELGRAFSTYGGGEVETGFWWGNLRVTDDLEEKCIIRRIILRCIFRRWNVREWTG